MSRSPASPGGVCLHIAPGIIVTPLAIAEFNGPLKPQQFCAISSSRAVSPFSLLCTLGISPAPAFVDDFPSDAHKFMRI